MTSAAESNVRRQDEFAEAICSTHGRYHDESGRFADTPKQLFSVSSQPDPAAVFSTLQYGAVIPPLAPWTGIRRVLPGYQYIGIERIRPNKAERNSSIKPLLAAQMADAVERLIDVILVRLLAGNEAPVLLFSGGVDSGLIASRLAALGYHDSLLINYSFGDNDPESQLAEQMAKHFGLKFERVHASPELCRCLRIPGTVYPSPFGDHATVASADLAHAVIERLAGKHCLILDGTGADGAFGMATKISQWKRISRLPRLTRRVASELYRRMLWYRCGRFEHTCRVLRRSSEMPLPSAVVAQNALAGITFDGRMRDFVDRLLSDWIGGWVGDSPAQRIVVTDMAVTCANMFAQKAQPILEAAGHSVQYPFLQNEIVSLAMDAVIHWSMQEPKSPLKESLARHVPREFVYRPKSGFVDRRNEVFFDPEFIDHLWAAAESTGPISFALHSATVRRACDLLRRGRKLPPQTLNCLWSIAFTDRWYRTAA